MPQVSVIIPAYNAAPWIAETLASVLAQTLQDFEIIVVDDGSTDETAEIVAKIEHIQYMHKANGGAASARNVGIRLARSEYIAFVDADDLWLPDKLYLQMELLRQTGLEWVYSDAYAFDGRTGGTLFAFSKLRRQYSGDVLRPLFLGDFIPMPTPIVRRGVFDEVGYFDESPKAHGVEDWDMWLRIAARYPIGLVNCPLARHRVHAASTVQSELPSPLYGRNLYVIERAISREPERLARLRNQSIARLCIRIGQFSVRRNNLDTARELFAQALRLNPCAVDAYVYWLGCFANQPVRDAAIRLVQWLRYKRSAGWRGKPL